MNMQSIDKVTLFSLHNEFQLVICFLAFVIQLGNESILLLNEH